jgi:hypothetical protein
MHSLSITLRRRRQAIDYALRTHVTPCNLLGFGETADPKSDRPGVLSPNPVFLPLRPVSAQIAQFRSLSEIEFLQST